MNKNINNELLNSIRQLDESDKQALVEKILNMMNMQGDIAAAQKENEFDSFTREVNGEVPACPHCGGAPVGNNIIRKGKNKTGAQRFYCKHCGKYFVQTTGTAFYGTHKSLSVWRHFIRLTITGASLALCAKECHIAYQTAFTWRHKVLNAFRVEQSKTSMDGWIEADEMFYPISYKGNHIRGKVGEERKKVPGVDTHMPRKAFKRGSDNKSFSGRNKTCVFCMVANASGSFYAAVPGIGFMTPVALDATIGKHVKKDSSLMLVDHYKVTKDYLAQNDYKHIYLHSNTSSNRSDHKPEIRGENRDIHLQHVNAMHTHLRKFMKDYCGVSSKYLENYVSLFVWLKNNGCVRRSESGPVLSEKRVARTDCYITGRQIETRPMIPVCVGAA